MNGILSEYIERHGFLDDTQFRFGKHHSTELALITSSELIRQTVNAGGNAALVLLDLSAAFDTVNHQKLLEVLRGIGIKGKVFTLFESFLSGREQFVALDEFKSPNFTLPCGVPWGRL